MYPEWAQRIRFSGDMRMRYQGNFFPHGNDQADAINFNGINTGSPYDRLSQAFWPTYNTSQDRQQTRLRARLGMEADLLSGFSAGMRIATGNDSSPVSTNQTLGASTSGGNFSKYALWLDRGYLKYQTWGDELTFSAGRFDNPFWSPADLVWYKELGFDGFAVQAKHQVYEGLTPFIVAGAFPIYNTDLNAGINLATLDPATGNAAPVKFASHDNGCSAVRAASNTGSTPNRRSGSPSPITISTMCRVSFRARVRCCRRPTSATPTSPGRLLPRRATPICRCAES
jgi:hypothetical protein